MADNINDMKTLRKLFEGSNIAALVAFEKPDGTLTDPGKPTLDFILETHFPSGRSIKPNKLQLYKSTQRDPN